LGGEIFLHESNRSGTRLLATQNRIRAREGRTRKRSKKSRKEQSRDSEEGKTVLDRIVYVT
jgi:hypothetical protein